jgi:hypothetical protein
VIALRSRITTTGGQHQKPQLIMLINRVVGE